MQIKARIATDKETESCGNDKSRYFGEMFKVWNSTIEASVYFRLIYIGSDNKYKFIDKGYDLRQSYTFVTRSKLINC